MANDLIIEQRGSDTAPPLSGYTEVTNPLHPATRTTSRLAHFADNVYDLSPESHISRILKVLLGDVGVGQLHKRMMLVRLQQILGGTHFFDLDAFYSQLFGVNRRAAEQLPLDPFRQNVTQAQWDQLRVRDGSYRSRSEQFARAIGFGATVGGLEQAAEAILGIDCEVREGWTSEDTATRTWSQVQAIGTYGQVEGFTWYSLEREGTTRVLGGRSRHLVTIIPKRVLTPEERYDVIRVLEKLKPAGSILEVLASPPEAFTQIPISIAASDSEHWEVRTQIANSAIEGQWLYRGDTTEGYIEMPSTPWASYQGEAWTLLVLNPAMVALTIPDGELRTDTQFTPSAQDLPPENYTLPSGDSVTFLPRYALRPTQSLFSGRMLSDGVMSANPYSGTRDQVVSPQLVEGGATTNIGFSTTGAANVDGADLDVLAAVGALRESVNHQTVLFWTTPMRPYDSEVVDVMEVRFNTPQTMNLIAFDIAHFPQDFEAQAWDPRTGRWVRLFSTTVRDSVPYSINGALAPGAVHPAHFGENHWIRVKESISHTTTDIVRFVFRRPAGGSAVYPLGIDGKPTSYPLAIRNVDLGYRLTSLEGFIPPTDPTVPVATSVNAVGQPTRHFIEVYRAGDALDSTEGVWRSQPQPVGEAVVNLYLDMRSASGTVPTVDRFYLDPLTSGPSFNLYWSAGAPSVDLASSLPQDTDILASTIRGNIRIFPSGDAGLLWDSAGIAYLDFANADLQLTPTAQDWWVGASLYALAPSNTLTRATVLSFGSAASVGDVAVSFDADVLKLTWLSQTVTVPAVFAVGDKLNILASFRPQADGTVILNAYVSVEGAVYSTATATYSAGTTVARPSTVRIGHTASNDSAVDPFPFRIIGMNVHYGSGVSAAADFFADPASFRQVPNPDDRSLATQLGSAYYDRTLGALLRFDPSFVRAGYTLGFIGGQPDIYGGLEWQPIARDYTLRKGYIKIPPTAGAIWKFEFSGLVPEPYETFLSVPRRVKLFSQQAQLSNAGGVTWSNDLLTAMSLASQGRFTDMPAVTTYVPSYNQSTRPTLGIVAPGPAAAEELRNRRGFPYNTIAWQPPSTISQYARAGTHVYNVTQVAHTNKVGFFVGLREVKAFRADYGVPENVTTYLDLFWDLANITAGMTMLADTNRIYTPSNSVTSVMPSARVATSRVFPSYEPVEAVQFATWQSAPVSVLYDENFRDPGLPASPFTDTDGWHSIGDARVIYDGINKTVRISRNPDIVQTIIGTSGPVVHPPVSPVFTTSPFYTTGLNPGSQGGIRSALVPVSPGGAVHAAVRLTAISNLAAPLYLQILGSDGTTVLSEVPFTPTAGVITEKTLSWRLGQIPSLEGSLRVAVVQKGGTRDEWSVQSFALFDDSVLWEWSNDAGATWVPAIGLRNNADGIIRFPTPGCGLRYRVTCYRFNTAITMVKIKPWYAGRVLGRHAFPQRGPNLSVFDDDVPIQEDPDFTSWTNPVPQQWFYRYQAFQIETAQQYGDSLFARALSRTAGDTVAVTDTATRSLTLVRHATDSVAVGDTATHTGSYARGGAESMAVDDDAHKVTWETLATPPVDPV